MRICLVKCSSLGDIIHCFPVISLIKQKYPKAEIDWVVEKPFAPLVTSHPEISKAILVDTRTWRKSPFSKTTRTQIKNLRKELKNSPYDYLLDLQGNFKSGLITALTPSPIKVGFSRESVPEWPNLLFTNRRFRIPKGRNIREDYLHLARKALSIQESAITSGITLKLTPEDQEKLNSILLTPFFKHPRPYLVCPGSQWKNKQLTTSTLCRFLQRVQSERECTFGVVWGNHQEKVLAEEISNHLPANCIVLERHSLPLLQNLMNHVACVLAMDSLPLHLAATTATPTFSFFGPSLADKYRPIGKQHAFFQGSCPYGTTFEKRCPILRTCKTGACLREVNEQALFERFQ